jgi:hypothetical protein
MGRRRIDVVANLDRDGITGRKCFRQGFVEPALLASPRGVCVLFSMGVGVAWMEWRRAFFRPHQVLGFLS